MQAPQHVKDRMRAVLLSCRGGLLIDEVDPEFRRQMQFPVPYRELSYLTLETFLRSIPDVARLEFSVRDSCLRVYGVSKDCNMGLQQQNEQGLPTLPGPQMGVKVSETKAGSSSGPDSSSSKQSVDQMEPDERGVYTLCFPSWQKPHGQFGTLEDMFGVAGKVFELYETSRWVYVCYKNLAAVRRAFKMFGHLGLKGASQSALKMDRERSRATKRKLETASLLSFPGTGSTRSQSIVPRKKKKAPRGGSQRVFVGNLNPTVKYTFDMFRKLFHDYRLAWISLKTTDADPTTPKTYANVLTVNRKDAEKMVAEFDGFIWYGRPLIMAIKEKGANKQKNSTTSGDGSSGNDDMPGLEPAMPGMEPAMPGLEPGMPGLEPGMSGLEPGMPRLEPGMPGLEPAMPGLEPAMPRFRPSMPGLEPGMPRLEPGMPRLEPGMPRLEQGMPGLEPGMPRFRPSMPALELCMPKPEPGMPGLEPSLPQLEPAMPGLEPIKCFQGRRWLKKEEGGGEEPLENLQVKRTFESPTLLVANLLAEADEASLKKLFAMYHPSKISMSAPHFGRRKAYITMRTVEDAREALHNLNHSRFQGKRLKVDVPYNRPQLRKTLGLDKEDSSSGSLTLSEVLKARGSLLKVLQVPDFAPRLGQRVDVRITAVISDKFFWGQVIDAIMAEELERVSDYLNSVPASDLHQASGPGRCMARYNDGKWYRAWVMCDQLNTDSCRVIYLDYGNTSKVPWNQTARVPERWPWMLPPLAIPFTLIDGIADLKTREMTCLTVEINALGSAEEGNMMVVRVVSLVPSVSTQAMSSVMRTIIV